MSRITGYDMIEKYLDGTMSHEASREFERLIRSDADLARELRSEELIRQTLAADVAALPAAAMEPSSLLTAKLSAGAAGSSGAASGAASGIAASVATSAASVGSTGIIGAIFGSGVGLTILGVTGIVGILIGIFLFNEEEARPQMSPIVIDSIERATPGATSDPTIPSSAQQPATPADENAIDEAAVTTPRTNATERNARDAKSNATGSTPQPAPDASAPSTPQTDELLNRLKKHDATPPPVVRNDSAKLRIEVE